MLESWVSLSAEPRARRLVLGEEEQTEEEEEEDSSSPATEDFSGSASPRLSETNNFENKASSNRLRRFISGAGDGSASQLSATHAKPSPAIHRKRLKGVGHKTSNAMNWRQTQRRWVHLMSAWGPDCSVGCVMGSQSCVMQRRGFNPPLSFRKRGFFPWS